MARITVYQKPTCTTCREVAHLLKEAGIDFEAVNYYLEPFSRKKLKSLLKKMGFTAEQLLRKRGPVYGKLGIAKKKLPAQKLIDLMVHHPDLIQRPIVEKGSRALLARPAKNLRRLL